jgi:hypothetical protein
MPLLAIRIEWWLQRSQGGAESVRQGIQNPALSARASSEPSNLCEITESGDFAIIIPEKKQIKTEFNP